jgi:hypothetical protein
MKRIVKYEEIKKRCSYGDSNYNVWFDLSEQPVFVSKNELDVLLIEDLLARHGLSKDVFNLLKQYKNSVFNQAYEEGLHNGFTS